MKLKGIATETIFYIVIGIVVVGLLVTLVISYTGSARSSSDCRVAQQQYCEYWENSGSATQPGETVWDDYNKTCTTGKPGKPACGRLGYNIP